MSDICLVGRTDRADPVPVARRPQGGDHAERGEDVVGGVARSQRGGAPAAISSVRTIQRRVANVCLCASVLVNSVNITDTFLLRYLSSSVTPLVVVGYRQLLNH